MRVLFCSCVIITNKSKVLITQRPSGKFMEGFWEFPGGKVELRETPEEALARELKEELNRKLNRELKKEVRQNLKRELKRESSRERKCSSRRA